jgi:hypothetical protein
MRVHLINPSHVSFGIGVITPRWLYVLAQATPARFGDPVITDETLEPIDLSVIAPGDIVGIGIHTGNALRGYELGLMARAAGATVVFGGIHATLFPEEARELGGAHAVVKGDGDQVWGRALDDCTGGRCAVRGRSGRARGPIAGAMGSDAAESIDVGLSADSARLSQALFVLLGVEDRRPASAAAGERPRRRGDRHPAAPRLPLRCSGGRQLLSSYAYGSANGVAPRRSRAIRDLSALRAERFDLMRRLAALPDDMVLFTQITMEAAEDPEFLDAMAAARIKGALVGVEAVTPEGLKDVHKEFNAAGDQLIDRLRAFKRHGVHVLGSFIFGLPSDRQGTFDATVAVAEQSGVTFAQFVMLTPFPGTTDFATWEKSMAGDPTRIAGSPLTRHWLIPQEQRPKVYAPHPVMSPDDIRRGTQGAWDRFYSLPNIWKRAHCVESLKSRLAFVLISKLYRQMYANTGIATDSARVGRSAHWARWIAKPCRRLFAASPMPGLAVPV